MAQKITKDELIDEKKLKRNELICAILGLVVATITAIFLFVSAVSFSVEITDGQKVNFSTSVFRFLRSDFRVVNGNTGFSYWSLYNSEFDLSALKNYEWLLVALAWISLIGCIASVLFYILFLFGKRFPFFCEMFSRMAVVGCGVSMLFFLIGEIKVGEDKLYAEGVSYNYIVPVIFMAVMVIALIYLSYLCNYSKKRRGALEQARINKAAESMVSAERTQLPKTQPVQNVLAPTVATQTTSSQNTMSEAQTTPRSEPMAKPLQTDNSVLRQAVLTKYSGEIYDNNMVAFGKGVESLSSDKLNMLLQKPIKKKIVTILLAIFLGGVGADRFYIGDKRMGFVKLLGTALTLLSRLIPLVWLTLILNLANLIWKFIDIFFSYKKGKVKNYDDAMNIIKS